MSSRSQFPEKYRLDAPQLQAALSGEHAFAATAVAHCGLYHAKQYPTDIEEGNRLHHLVASTTMGINRPRVIAEAAVRNAISVIDHVGRDATRTYTPPTRKDYNRLAAALEQVLIDALAIQPEFKVFEADPSELAYEVLRDEIILPIVPEAEQDAWMKETTLSLLAIGAAHPDLLYQLSRLCSKAAEKAQKSARRKLKKADDEEHKRFNRASGGFVLPLFLADAIELGRSEVQLRREANAETLAAEVLAKVGTAARDGKAASDYVTIHRDDLISALDDMREGAPHLTLDNTIPVEIVLAQIPEPSDAPRELAGVLYAAITTDGDTPAAVARTLFTAISEDLASLRLDPVAAILDYLGNAGYDDTAIVARATDELLAPALAAHAEKAAALLAGDLPQPTTYVVHTSPFALPFFSTGLFEAELRVEDPALDDVVTVLSFYPYRLRDLVFHSEARVILDSPDANRFYANPARKPSPAFIRPSVSTHLNGQSPTAESVLIDQRAT